MSVALKDLQAQCGEVAVARRWMDPSTPRSVSDLVELLQGEVAKVGVAGANAALSPTRTYVQNQGKGAFIRLVPDDPTLVRDLLEQPAKPEGVPAELADVLIRVLQIGDELGIDLEDAVARKLAHQRAMAAL